MLALVVASACPPPLPPPVVQQCPAGVRVCENDRRCVEGFCDKVDDGDGIPADSDAFGCCRVVSACPRRGCEGGYCNEETGQCEPIFFCDPENASECDDGEVCAYDDGFHGGRCRAPDSVESCVIAAGAATTTSSRALEVAALPFASETELATTFSPTYSASAGTISDDGELIAQCDDGVCIVEITAQYDGASCSHDVRVLAPPPVGDTRVAVIDAIDGTPLVDVLVASDGETLRTNADGIAIFAGARDAVSAFPDTHAWHSVLEPPSDVLIATARTHPTTSVAGAKGVVNFDSVHTIGDIKLALVGVSSPTPLPDLSLAPFFTEPVITHIDIEGVTAPGGEDRLVPLNAVIELGAEPIKGGWVALGKPGRSITWSLGGQVRLAELGDIISTVATTGAVLPLFEMTPFLAAWDHDVREAVTLSTEARPVDTSDLTAWPFEETVMEPKVLLGLGTVVRVDGSSIPTDGIVVVAGSVVPGHGLVPLGLGAARRDEAGNFEGGSAEGTANEVTVDYAPAHSGLSAGTQIVTVAAVDATEVEALTLRSISTRTFVFADRILSDITVDALLALPSGTFVAGESASVDVVAGATMYRIRLDDGAGGEWSVWSPRAFSFDVLAHNPDGAARAINATAEAFALDAAYDEVVSSKLDRLTLEPGEWSATKLE